MDDEWPTIWRKEDRRVVQICTERHRKTHRAVCCCTLYLVAVVVFSRNPFPKYCWRSPIILSFFKNSQFTTLGKSEPAAREKKFLTVQKYLCNSLLPFLAAYDYICVILNILSEKRRKCLAKEPFPSVPPSEEWNPVSLRPWITSAWDKSSH